LQVVTFSRQTQGTELVGLVDRLVDPQRWQTIATQRADVAGAGLAARETLLRSRTGYLVLWHWYVVDGVSTPQDWLAKLLEARAAILFSAADSKLILLSAENAEIEAARDALREFAQRFLAHLESCLGDAPFGCSDPRL
jgi:EpsI family protein